MSLMSQVTATVIANGNFQIKTTKPAEIKKQWSERFGREKIGPRCVASKHKHKWCSSKDPQTTRSDADLSAYRPECCASNAWHLEQGVLEKGQTMHVHRIVGQHHHRHPSMGSFCLKCPHRRSWRPETACPHSEEQAGNCDHIWAALHFLPRFWQRAGVHQCLGSDRVRTKSVYCSHYKSKFMGTSSYHIHAYPNKTQTK